MESPHSVLMMCPLFSVLVLWMNYQISSFILSHPPPPLYLPNIVDTRFTRGSNCIHRTTLGCQFCGTVWPNCKTLDYFFLIALSSVGFVCQAIVWSDLHSWREVSWLLSCDVEHCCCPSPSKCDTLLGHVCFVGYTARVFLGGGNHQSCQHLTLSVLTSVD